MVGTADRFSRREVLAEASAWVAQLETGDMTSADLAALREWMGRSPVHQAELTALARLSSDLGDLSFSMDAVEASLSKRSRAFSHRSPVLRMAAGGLAALTLLAVSVIFFAGRGVEPIYVAEYATVVGETRLVTLPDGSTITLNTDTEISVSYRPTARDITLASGEALFDVVRDPARPFAVATEDAVSVALGTKFVVRRTGAETLLSVVDGVVAFRRADEARAAPGGLDAIDRAADLVLRVGETVRSTDVFAEEPTERETIADIGSDVIARQLSWTEGLFEFSETPLQEVVAELERHNAVRITIADDELKSLRMGGIFRTSDVDLVLEAFEGLGIEVERQSDTEVVLRPKSEAEQNG